MNIFIDLYIYTYLLLNWLDHTQLWGGGEREKKKILLYLIVYVAVSAIYRRPAETGPMLPMMAVNVPMDSWYAVIIITIGIVTIEYYYRLNCCLY